MRGRARINAAPGVVNVRVTRLAILGMMCGALALGACGRAGPLEPPPDYEKSEDDTTLLDPLIDPPLPSN